MTPEKISALVQGIKNAQQRNPDALRVLSAVAGISMPRLQQLVAGDPDATPMTQSEFTTLSMLRGA